MRLLGLVFAILLITSVNVFAKEEKPVGLNCSLTSPPPISGEDSHKKTKLLIYPRVKGIGSDYTGCQSVWAPLGQGWSLLTLVYFKNGEVVRL